MHNEPIDAVLCFLSHENDAEDFQPELDNIDLSIEETIEKYKPTTLIYESILETTNYLKTLKKTLVGEKVNRADILRNLAKAVYHTRLMCELFAEPDELNLFIEDYAKSQRERN